MFFSDLTKLTRRSVIRQKTVDRHCGQTRAAQPMMLSAPYFCQQEEAPSLICLVFQVAYMLILAYQFGSPAVC
jgi:hypothetical protein